MSDFATAKRSDWPVACSTGLCQAFGLYDVCIPSLNIGCETVVNVYYFFQVTKDSLVNVEKQKEFFLSLLKNASSFIQLEALATLLQTWPDTWYVCSLGPGLLNWFQAQTQTQATFWLAGSACVSIYVHTSTSKVPDAVHVFEFSNLN